MIMTPEYEELQRKYEELLRQRNEAFKDLGHARKENHDLRQVNLLLQQRVETLEDRRFQFVRPRRTLFGGVRFETSEPMTPEEGIAWVNQSR